MIREANEAAGQSAATELAAKAISESEQQRMLREAAEAMRQSEAEAHEALGDDTSSVSSAFNWRPVVAGGVALALLGLLWMTFAGRDRSPADESSAPSVAIAEVPVVVPAEPGPQSFPPEATDQVATDRAAEAAEPEVEPAPPLEEVGEVLNDWASSWAAQRVDDYLSHYAAAFSPPKGMSRADWEANRHDRIGRPEWIRVTLGGVDTDSSAPDRATATFEQTYESPSYKDRVRKTVEMVWEAGAWKILSEASMPQG